MASTVLQQLPSALRREAARLVNQRLPQLCTCSSFVQSYHVEKRLRSQRLACRALSEQQHPQQHPQHNNGKTQVPAEHGTHAW
jgi:hypothetical protein